MDRQQKRTAFSGTDQDKARRRPFHRRYPVYGPLATLADHESRSAYGAAPAWSAQADMVQWLWFGRINILQQVRPVADDRWHPLSHRP